MGLLKDGIGGVVASALEDSDGIVNHEVRGDPTGKGIGHEVSGPLSGAVRHEVLGDGGAVIHHRVTEVGDLRLTAERIRIDPVAVQVPPVVVRVGAEALSRLRLRVPATFSLRLSLFGREIARLDLTGSAQVEGDLAGDQDLPVT